MVAAIQLARPYSNAQQERDFSLATWFDGNLVQKQRPETLEKRLVGCLNRNVVKELQQLLESHNEFASYAALECHKESDSQGKDGEVVAAAVTEITSLDDSSDDDNEEVSDMALNDKGMEENESTSNDI
ncbi:hypothetical protein ACA910_019638 [Epithemia clementina (nom. ined.)]